MFFELFVQAVCDSDEALTPLLLLLAGWVPGTLSTNLQLSSVEETMSSLNVLIVGPLHCLPSESKVLDNMLCRRKFEDHARRRKEGRILVSKVN